MESVQKLTEHHYTKEEYLELLRDSLHKYEYLDGVVRMMAGGTAAHADIVDNTFVALRTAAHGCRVKSSETAVSIASLNRYFFPDASAVCDLPPQYEDGGGIARLTNPALIVEVLSDSTADYDRTEKFSAYRRLDSFREYVLIDSRRHYVETFYREQQDLWHIGNYHRMEQMVPFRTLGVEVELSKLYEGVEFPEASDSENDRQIT
jgi:Uma2 family endonuclease